MQAGEDGYRELSADAGLQPERFWRRIFKLGFIEISLCIIYQENWNQRNKPRKTQRR